MKEQFLTDVGARLSSLRKEMRLTQEELAEKADTTKQTISFAEGGKREMLASNVVKLADALDVSTDYLLKGTRTDADLKYLDSRMQNLSVSQYAYLQITISKFLDLCENGEML